MSPVPVIAPIVEGHGERSAVPTLIRRIAGEIHGAWGTAVAPAFRLDSGKMRNPDDLARAVRFQAARVEKRGGIIILRDGDDADVDCPVVLARQLAPDAQLVKVRVEVVIAWHEYEAWFLAALESLSSHPAVRDDALPPADPEAARGAKQQFADQMTESYKETLHQDRFSAQLDLKAATASSRSFRRLVHAVELLLLA